MITTKTGSTISTTLSVVKCGQVIYAPLRARDFSGEIVVVKATS